MAGSISDQSRRAAEQDIDLCLRKLDHFDAVEQATVEPLDLFDAEIPAALLRHSGEKLRQLGGEVLRLGTRRVGEPFHQALGQQAGILGEK